MGDEALSLSASLCSMFLRLWAVFSQSLKAVVAPVKNFRWASPWTHSIVGLVVGNDIWWFIFNLIPPMFTSLGIINLTGVPHVFMIYALRQLILVCGSSFIHNLVLFSVLYWYRDMPFHLIGAKGKFMLEFVPMIMLAAFHHLLEFNDGYLYLMMGLTTYFYIIAHFMHGAYDIGGKDVLLGLVMQVVAYIVKGGLLVRGLVLSLCVVVCLYRYVMYSAPEVPMHHKKELEELPC